MKKGSIKNFVKIWRNYFYTDRRQKKVPDEILNAPTNIIKTFMQGYYDADGDRQDEEIIAGDWESRKMKRHDGEGGVFLSHQLSFHHLLFSLRVCFHVCVCAGDAAGPDV